MSKKEIVDIPLTIKESYKDIQTLQLQELGIRKKITVFLAKDSKDNKSIVFYITQKSRFLQKDVEKIEEINNIILNAHQFNIVHKKIFIESALCSKAKEKLTKLSWEVLA